MNILPHAAAHSNHIVHRGHTYVALPIRLRLALSLSDALRKAAGWLNRLADRLETWARVRSLLSGHDHAFDTITLTPLGATDTATPLTVTRDACSRVIALHTPNTARPVDRGADVGVRP